MFYTPTLRSAIPYAGVMIGQRKKDV